MFGKQWVYFQGKNKRGLVFQVKDVFFPKVNLIFHHILFKSLRLVVSINNYFESDLKQTLTKAIEDGRKFSFLKFL